MSQYIVTVQEKIPQINCMNKVHHTDVQKMSRILRYNRKIRYSSII